MDCIAATRGAIVRFPATSIINSLKLLTICNLLKAHSKVHSYSIMAPFLKLLIFLSLLDFFSSTFCIQLAAVHLVDSHYCSDPSKFVSVLLTSLSTMIQMELPHVNVLSKIDIIEQYGKLGR